MMLARHLDPHHHARLGRLMKLKTSCAGWASRGGLPPGRDPLSLSTINSTCVQHLCGDIRRRRTVTYHGNGNGTFRRSCVVSASSSSSSSSTRDKGTPWVKFCASCGAPTMQAIPPTEDRLRAVCTNSACAQVHYVNPKMVVGTIVACDDSYEKILLVKRANEPCKGLWTVPAGFMELGESAADGARRETAEEALCDVDIVAPFIHLDLPAIGQSYVLFRAQPADTTAPFSFGNGSETEESKIVHINDLHQYTLAFTAVSVALEKYAEDVRNETKFRVHHGTITKRPGALPSDMSAFKLEKYICS